YGIEALIIAIPSLNYKDLRRIYTVAKSLKVETIKIVPRIYDFHAPCINVKNLEDIQTEDLLGRQVVEIDSKEINTFLKHKIILITGAGGSIGSEIAIQACSFQPEKVILLDIDETELHNVNHRLKRLYPNLFNSTLLTSRTQDKVVLITGDIRDVGVVDEVFEKFKPHIVFHAAAYKHVPMMEINCKEAVKVNMFGTYNLVKASTDNHVEKFILISTDKAVRPTSIMGATKRMAEYICTAFNDASGTSFVSVRFGNVLGSRGSVVPTFLEQLKHGGPITITHKDVERFFMTIPEAVSLVLQASVIGKGGDVLVLDMGEPVKILTLAEELIRIHGLQPYRDIDIQFIGLRAGEKLFEEPLSAEEGTNASKHKKIFTARNGHKYSRDEI
ncbi:MAG TPA: nucleoside-diphosphate sugar epimerase/dehydratase, partial [Candidatus Brocadiales bacterium]|nr:nucleoside-diphosphate sugar epimerase/dehydratase [Candidatus Brocadiales bacterium]